MIIELVNKEFKNEYSNKTKSVGFKVFAAILFVVTLVLLIALESFIFKTLDVKLTRYSKYGSYDFLIFFLAIMSLVSIVSALISSRKVFYNNLDHRILGILPVSGESIVISKIIFVYLKEILLNLCISTPLLITYGSVRSFMPTFYVFSILYPFFISVFVVGIALILLTPYQYLYKLVKKHDLIQFIFATLLMVGLCFVYQFVLDLFLQALSDSSIGGVFSDSFIEFVHKSVLYFVPIYNFLDILVNSNNIFQNIAIYLGSTILVFVIGVLISSYFYFKIEKMNINTAKDNVKKKKAKLTSPFKALIKKEAGLLFKDSTNLFSYTSLLIMIPFLSFVVISSLNSTVYKSLNIYSGFMPELINSINLLLILLFIGIVSINSSSLMNNENKAIIISKTLPISAFLQVIAKILLPMVLSVSSLLVTVSILMGTKLVTLPVGFIALFIGIVMIVFINFFGIIFEMHDKGNVKYKLSYITNLSGVLIPFFNSLMLAFMSLEKLDTYVYYVTLFVFNLLFLVPFFFKVRKRINRTFLKMEVRV